jgi:SPOR domain
VRSSLILIVFICQFFQAYAQKEKKISFNLMAGAAFLNKSEKLAPSGLPQNIFGGYKPGIAGGAGISYRLSEKMYLFENISIVHTKKANFRLNLNTFRTGLKYNILSPEKRFSPFVSASVDLALVFLNRAKNTRDVFPDSTANSIGTGFGATKITYNQEQLKLSAVPTLGTSLGAGFDFRLSPKFSLFLLYSFSHNLAKQPKLIKDNYPYNNSNLNYHMVTGGITIRLFTKARQLLANLAKAQWEGDNIASLKGTIIYKKPSASKKEEKVEMTNDKDSTLRVISSDKEGLFKIPDLPRNDYKFYLAKRNKKIDRADLELIHDHRLKLSDDYLSLEMFDELESENFISREGNYSVVLREGFQHEVNLSVTGLSINGRLDNFSPDTSCHRVMLLLYDKKDSLIKSTTPMADCSFRFADIVPGAYKMVIREKDKDQKVSFNYAFTGAQPTVSRQFNSVAPKLSYMIAGKIDLKDSIDNGIKKEVLIKLIDPESKVVKDTALTQDGKFHFDNLPSDKYTIAYEPEPKVQGKLEYTIDDNVDVYHEEYSYNFGVSPLDNTGQITARGKLTTLKPDQSYVYLVTKDNEVKAKVRPGPDGKFSFTNLPSKNFKIAYQLDDASATAKLNYDFIDETGIGEETVVLSATGSKVQAVKQKIQGNVTTKNPGGVKVERYNVISVAHMESGKTYDSEGHAVKVQGFGIQVASYKWLENLKRHYAQIQDAGIKDAYIQVVRMTVNGESVKFYRIVIGSHNDLNDLRDRDTQLKEKGFSTTYRKHL